MTFFRLTEIDELYERRRQLQSVYRKEKDSYQEVKGHRRKDSWRRRENHSERREEDDEVVGLEAESLPFEVEVHICNTLLNHLSRLTQCGGDSVDSVSPQSSQGNVCLSVCFFASLFVYSTVCICLFVY